MYYVEVFWNGEWTLVCQQPTKEAADRRAQEYRQEGYRARVTKDGNYVV